METINRSLWQQHDYHRTQTLNVNKHTKKTSMRVVENGKGEWWMDKKFSLRKMIISWMFVVDLQEGTSLGAY